MADVTINELTRGVPTGNNILPYSTGSNTLGVPVSAILQNAGNIGIGTATPEVKLHVIGDICTPGRMGIGTVSPARQLTVDSATNPEIGMYTSGTERVKFSTGGSAISQLVIDTAGQPRVTINSTGMGIGTTAPAEKLTVMGNISASGDVKASNTPKAWAWVNFSGYNADGTNSPITGSYNVSSVYKNGNGDYTINFSNTISSFAWSGSTNGSSAADYSLRGLWEVSRTTTSLRVRVQAVNSGSQNPESNSSNSVIIFGS
jgi:hypothetical protein